MADKFKFPVPKSLMSFKFLIILNFPLIYGIIPKMDSISLIVCHYYFQSINQSGKFTKYNPPSSTCIQYPLQLEMFGRSHCKYQTFNIGPWMRSLLIVPSIGCISNVSASYMLNSFITNIWFLHGISISSKSIYVQQSNICLRIELSVAQASLENASKFSLLKYSSCQIQSVWIIMQLCKWSMNWINELYTDKM